jgi:hypothetical protein
MGTIPPPHDVLWHGADALAHVVAAREALVDGDLTYTAAILERLELDLIAVRVLLEERAA